MHGSGTARYRNKTLRVETDGRIAFGLVGDNATRGSALQELTGWLGYSSKLGQRWDAGDSDLYTLLPPSQSSYFPTHLK